MFGKIQHKSKKGFGFVRQQAENGQPVQDLFLHHTEYLGDWEKLKTGDWIEFTPGVRKGNPIAVEVRLLAKPTEMVSEALLPTESVSGASDEQSQ